MGFIPGKMYYGKETKMKRQKSLAEKIFGVVAVLLIVYCFLTPMGSLRFTLAISGHPITAVTAKVMDEPYRASDLKDTQTMYSLENPPVEKATQAELTNWLVTRYGPFCFCEYYGW